MATGVTMLFPSNKKKAVFASLIACLFAVIYISLNWIGIIDDAYIFFRYAHNITQGYGYVFNIGQPVEGTTSVTWTILLVILNIFHIPAEVSVKILGGLCVLAILFLLGAECYKTDVSISILFLVFALLIFDKNFILSTMMGLETGLYALLLLAICIVSRWYSERGGRFLSITMSGIGVLLFLTRPESLGILVLIGCGIIFYRQKYNTRCELMPILVWILGISVITLWRWSVFGDFIPNSARAKSILEFSDMRLTILWPRIVEGSLYIKNLFMTSWLLVMLGIFGLVSMRKTFWGYVAFSALFIGIGVVLINSGDWMPRFRLLTPYLPTIALLAAAGLNKLRMLPKNHWTQILELIVILIAFLIALNSFWLLRGKKFFVADQWPSGECYKRVGQVLRPHLSRQTVVAPEAIGIIGYTLIDIPVLDFFGLTDPFIARNGVIPIETYTMGKTHFEYTMQQSPALFFFHSNINSHIPFLNQWGYSSEYETFRITNTQAKCELFVGAKNSLVPELLPILEQNFIVQFVDTSKLQKSSAATWPNGER
jgi:hypothetical protein